MRPPCPTAERGISGAFFCFALTLPGLARWTALCFPASAPARRDALPAFANALTVGVDTLELDVGVTADGEVVVSHERGLNPDLARDETGVDGIISDRPDLLRQVASEKGLALPAGTPVEP